MQQRVGLARALASDPEVLLMDEPFSARDPLIRRQLQDQFLSLSANLTKTTMFITHGMDEAIRIGNRIAIMKDGRIVQIGTPEAIVTNPIDDYVRDFAAGISTRKLVFAHSIMERIDAYKPRAGEDPSLATRAGSGTDLSELIDHDGPAHRDHPWRRGCRGRRQGHASQEYQGWRQMMGKAASPTLTGRPASPVANFVGGRRE